MYEKNDNTHQPKIVVRIIVLLRNSDYNIV